MLARETQGDGPPLMLVPGSLTGWVSWIPHQQRLLDAYRVIRVQPIHNELGSAGVPGDPGYTAATERESLRLTLDDLALPSAHFAGWSGGARALLEFAMQYPSRVRTLTLVEPAAYWILDQLSESDAQVTRLNEFLHDLAGNDVSDDDLATFLELAGLVSKHEDAFGDPNWTRWQPHRLALSWQGEHADRPHRSVDELAAITCPVLLVRGTDTTPWLRRVTDVLADRLTDTKVLDLPGNHACHIENIDAFLNALHSHLIAAEQRR